jgi:hypothetical protein
MRSGNNTSVWILDRSRLLTNVTSVQLVMLESIRLRDEVLDPAQPLSDRPVGCTACTALCNLHTQVKCLTTKRQRHITSSWTLFLVLNSM